MLSAGLPTPKNKPMIRRIVIPVSEIEFRDFKIQAINQGTTVPKLAREKLFPAAPVATTNTEKPSK